MNGRLLGAMAFAAAAQFAAHWYPPTEPWKLRGPVKFIVLCTYGVSTILAALGIATDRKTLAKGAAISVAAGASTVSAHLIDALLRRYYAKA